MRILAVDLEQQELLDAIVDLDNPAYLNEILLMKEGY